MTVATLGMGATLLPTFGYGGESAIVPIPGCVHLASRLAGEVVLSTSIAGDVKLRSALTGEVELTSEAC